MKIKVAEIPNSGLELNESYWPGDLDLNRADIEFTEPINLSCEVKKGINNIAINLKINATMYLNCSRCLEEFIMPLSKEVKLNFLIEHQEVVDLTDNLREEIILEYPLKPLCRPDCRGLCLRCGQNLNQGKCNCPEDRKQKKLSSGTK